MSLTSDPPVDAPPKRPDPEDCSALKVVPVRHPWRWAAIVATAVLVAQFAHGLATNPGWEWEVFADFFTTQTIMKAVGVTLQLTFYGTALGFALGIVLAFMRLSASPFLKTVAFTYIIGRLSGGGDRVQGKIAATTKKGSGLVEAYAAAIDHVIKDGSYARVLGRWGLSTEAVRKSEINPRGLPKTA